MEKILKNIHWLIIAAALFNNVMIYKESDEKKAGVLTKLEEQRKILQSAKKSKKEILSFYKDIDEAKNRIERVAKEIEKTQQLLPSDISDIENISLLRGMAEDVNIKEVSIAPDVDEDRGFYLARKYKFKAKATYLQFLIVFEKISENKRILNISDLVFKKIEQPQRSKFQLIDGEFDMEAYRFNSKFKEERGIETIEKNFKDSQIATRKSARRAGAKPKDDE
jgi:Tfp pilus assembly protein PilO